MAERLQKLMAQAGLGSRRHNEELIRAGRVRVNGRLAHLGDKADPQNDQITVDGQAINLAEEYIYIALHKPKGVISSLEDELEQERTTERDLVNLPGHFYPVGRLDKQSEGLMLMTSDGQLAHKLTHPRYGHEKVYEVILEGEIAPNAVQQWQQGVMLDDKLTAPAQVTITKQQGDTTHLRIVMREGRKRQIRRVAASFGTTIRRLVRVQIGPIKLGELRPKQWRHLSQEEVRRLKQSVEQKQASGQPQRRRRGHK
jgi:pseudouridine synthase